MHTLEDGIWSENLKNMENEKRTLYNMVYGEKKH